MLVLSRNINESIVIGENCEIDIKILEITGRQVKIGISAPKIIPVNRLEVFNKARVGNNKKNL